MRVNISVLSDSEPAPQANQLWLRLPMARGLSVAIQQARDSKSPRQMPA